MGDEADWMIDQALDLDVYGKYHRHKIESVDVLKQRFWVSKEGECLFPEQGEMELGHIQAVKALERGEKKHEKELQKAQKLNEGVIKW